MEYENPNQKKDEYKYSKCVSIFVSTENWRRVSERDNERECDRGKSRKMYIHGQPLLLIQTLFFISLLMHEINVRSPQIHHEIIELKNTLKLGKCNNIYLIYFDNNNCCLWFNVREWSSRSYHRTKHIRKLFKLFSYGFFHFRFFNSPILRFCAFVLCAFFCIIIDIVLFRVIVDHTLISVSVF